ncbi:hypothetical protein F9L16_02150 [Agarivorans sp. B2Z047]|uniref:Uncharacterized protein n=1 Tax=Agarivorans albus MKT 106 TaxID=1331007 RepID=R9PMR7_AGAAL|nr:MULTISPECIES: hypothetical protein [Agarivorans]MPW27796.1 hypothetical protein [Agarivorans sp. B2Z047]UQN44370.1 hypothetical protein LQZ07_07820 [Agarivorans sp. B2Z047]GAD02654.1 hypothetical protein AALB_2734 [Agarivorans albus MKT 106]
MTKDTKGKINPPPEDAEALYDDAFQDLLKCSVPLTQEMRESVDKLIDGVEIDLNEKLNDEDDEPKGAEF